MRVLVATDVAARGQLRIESGVMGLCERDAVLYHRLPELLVLDTARSKRFFLFL